MDTVLANIDHDGYLKFNTPIKAGTNVTFCDNEDEYDGVLVNEEGMSCGGSSPIPVRRDYDGPCKSGWIKSIFLELLAG